MSHRLDHALKETSSENFDENEVQIYYIFKKLLAIIVNSDFFFVLNIFFSKFNTPNCTSFSDLFYNRKEIIIIVNTE